MFYTEYYMGRLGINRSYTLKLKDKIESKTESLKNVLANEFSKIGINPLDKMNINRNEDLVGFLEKKLLIDIAESNKIRQFKDMLKIRTISKKDFEDNVYIGDDYFSDKDGFSIDNSVEICFVSKVGKYRNNLDSDFDCYNGLEDFYDKLSFYGINIKKRKNSYETPNGGYYRKDDCVINIHSKTLLLFLVKRLNIFDNEDGYSNTGSNFTLYIIK